MIADYDAGMPLNQLLKVPAYPPGMSPPQILREMGLTGEPA
jgi:hypothetical protein